MNQQLTKVKIGIINNSQAEIPFKNLLFRSELIISYLVDKRSSERIFIIEDLGPELHVSPSDQVPCFGLEERVLVADGDQLAVALTPLVGHAGQVRVALLAVAADHFAVVVRILSGKR